jgi:hypothetical protein
MVAGNSPGKGGSLGHCGCTQVEQNCNSSLLSCPQALEARLPLQQVTLPNKFGVNTMVEELPVQ